LDSSVTKLLSDVSVTCCKRWKQRISIHCS